MYEFQSIDPSFPLTFHSHNINHSWKTAHWHENIEIINITRGSASAVIGNEEVHVNAGDTIVITNYALHQIFTDTVVAYDCLIIDIKFLMQFKIDLSEYISEHKISDEKITHMFKNMKKLSSDVPKCFQIEMCAEALKIIGHILREHSVIQNTDKAQHSFAKSHMVREAISYMKKNLDTQISLEDIANHLGFNKYYLCRTFKNVTGTSVVKMLNFLRCSEAKRLIITTGRTINEIAMDCGYSNLSYFAKIYKETIGCLPSDTKKHFSEKNNL